MSVATAPATQANSQAHGVPNRMTAGAIPPEVETFLHNVADSFIKIELIKFFRRNQHLLGTVEDIAVAIGRDKRTTARAVPHLLSAGVLKATGRGSAVLWSYAPDPQMTERIDAFLAYYKTEKGQRAIICRLLEAEV
jgi:hypothetical protein